MSLRDRVEGLLPSRWLKDGLLGGVGILAIRISYVYLKAFAARPDLLARMGPGLILGILALSIAGVLVNQLVDALGKGISRIAESTERTAACQAEGAEAQRQLAASQAVIATSIQQLACKDDRQLQQFEVLIGTVVVQARRIIRKLHAQDRALERLEDKVGINRPPVETEEGEGQ